MKVVINTCFGGFGLSDLAYEELIKLGIPVRKHIPEKRGLDGLYLPEPLNDGKIIFDNTLNDEYEYDGDAPRYWTCWVDEDRTNPLVIQVIEKLGEKSWGGYAVLKIVEIPDDIEWEIDEYDGAEHIAEKHRTWK